MKNLICTSIVVLGILQLGATAAAQHSIPDLAEMITPSIATIVTYGEDDQPLKQGSGFFVDNQHIVSSLHIFEGANRAEAILYDQSRIPLAGFVHKNVLKDQICVRVTATRINVRRFQYNVKAVPRPGETVIVVGSPFGLEHSITEGIISSIRNDDRYGQLIQITAPISPGSSGSPVLNLKGELIGVATFQFVAGQNLNFAVPFEKLNNLHQLVLQSFSTVNSLTSSDIIPSDLQFLLAAGISFINHRYDEALQHYQKGIRANPLNIEAHIGAGKCKWYLKDIKSAEAYFAQALKIEPENALPYYMVAAFYHSLGTHAKQVQLLVSKASLLNLKSADDYLTASDELLKMGDLRKAYDYVNFVLHHSQNKILIYLRLSILYESHKLRMKKIEALEAILKIFPSTNEQYIALVGDYASMGLKNKMRIYKEIGETYDQIGMSDKMKQTYEKAALDKPETADGYYTLGKMFHGLGRYREEIDCHKNAIMLDSMHFHAHYDLAMLYKELGIPNDAIEFLKRAIIIDPDDSSAFLELGAIYLEHKYYQDAANSFKQLIRISPDAGFGYHLLGLTYLYAGEVNQALIQLEILRKIDTKLANDLHEAIIKRRN